MMSIATNRIPLSAALETFGDISQEGTLSDPNFLLNDSEMSKNVSSLRRDITEKIDFLSSYEGSAGKGTDDRVRTV